MQQNQSRRSILKKGIATAGIAATGATAATGSASAASEFTITAAIQDSSEDGDYTIQLKDEGGMSIVRESSESDTNDRIVGLQNGAAIYGEVDSDDQKDVWYISDASVVYTESSNVSVTQS